MTKELLSSKRILKFATGELVPEGAVYLGTVTQTEFEHLYGDKTAPHYPRKEWLKCWYVWHYFLVETES